MPSWKAERRQISSSRLILGPTGAGKSTFINTALNKEELEVGHNLTSCTTKLQPVIIDPIPGFPHLKGYRLVLVDTPGFNDTFTEDVHVLENIATWLAESYRKKMVVVGVLYLHDISLKRFTGTARRNLGIFSRICGNAALNKVIFATTNCGIVPAEADERHEAEMRSTHWKTMLDMGAEVHRFSGNSTSAWDIINVFLERADTHRNNPGPLQIQRELVDEGITVHDTNAGKFLRKMKEKLTYIAQIQCVVQ
ncbi:hypothetical protein GALMADRAFT_222142 [Galerina marginata CBS 339.88]|uniref:G domain-containing protein n=1 Tax=Galerina marginata (strain CBS 339.88) TaxID=685588 RepID=A0A067TBN9_GALM3|nr:hypothetical protein GALMADRAFT_222142 [Galerina marginata CBS 339.88]